MAALLLSPGAVWDPIGIAAALVGAACMAAGTFLARRWRPDVPVLAFTGWQLLAGGLMLVPVAWTAFDRDESFHLLEQWPQARSVLQIRGVAVLAGFHVENDGNHFIVLARNVLTRSQSTARCDSRCIRWVACSILTPALSRVRGPARKRLASASVHKEYHSPCTTSVGAAMRDGSRTTTAPDHSATMSATGPYGVMTDGGTRSPERGSVAR